MKPRRAETAIAKPVLRLLGEMGFDLYQEVPLGARADIVGILGGKTVCVVECKASLSFDVLAQAQNWIKFAHWRFVAVPAAKASDGRRLARNLAEDLGIGVIEVTDRNDGANFATVRSYPRLNRACDPGRMLKALRPEHKTFAEAGSNGSHWSPWRESIRSLVSEVEREPGQTLAAIIAKVPHHWANNSSAKGCVARQIQAGLIKGLRLQVDGKVLRVYPDDLKKAP